MLFLAWMHGGNDPYCLYNGLDSSFIPWGGGFARPPQFPFRVRAFVYACGVCAEEFDGKRTAALAGR